MDLYEHDAAKKSMKGMTIHGRGASPELHRHGGSHVEGAVQSGVGEYPVKVGACQYYLRTGTCKFGANCKFNHPRNDGGPFEPLNVFGYPLRPEEKKCSYYLRTGRCQYGSKCKFHHPQPVGMPSPAAACLFYPTLQNLSSSSAEQHGGPSASYRVANPRELHGSYVPGAYSAVLNIPLVLPSTNWSAYSYPGPLTPGAPLPGTYPPYPSSLIQKEQPYPVRPGQAECQYYMRTGDCKFRTSCRYHHPPGRFASKKDCLLSPEGLPLCPGVQPCTCYMQNGYCKVGRECRFDHPV